ncbi:16S rRNA (guanine(527)-N(7))-methyltransferase RsmG [Roseovarius salis]|uniref:16S rRNA (guanine(527)-N(7))-methyltransferase RsmG n=1 Tax=Roseovarius salis TaxID=3376063 RepID=UPI0037C9F62E
MKAEGRLDVSRETIERLETYATLLRKWSPRINLVAKSTLDDLWTRHIIDSAQVFALAPRPVRHWADLGSGGGFPGIVVAILAAEAGHQTKVTLVENDQRKCAFLRTVLRETAVAADVVRGRIEEIPPLQADVVSARALADLTTLLGYAHRHMPSDGLALFHKGVTWKKELEDAQTSWKFQYRVARSETGEGPVILSISGVSRV